MIARSSMALVSVWALLAASEVAAQEGDDASCTTADCHIGAGLAARAQGRDEAAIESFRAAYDLGGTPRALAQLALAEQAVGRWVDAELHLTDALGRDDAWVRGHRAVLESALGIIREHVGQLEVTANVEGATLSVNGAPAGTLPLSAPVSVEVGTAVLELSADGYVPIQRRTEIAPGQLSRIRVAMVESVAPVASAPPVETADAQHAAPRPSGATAPRGPSLLVITGAIASGLSVLALAGTIAAAIVREEHVLLWNNPTRCPPLPDGRLASCPGEHSTWRTAEDWAIAGAITTGALAALGLTLLALAAGESDQDADAAAVALDLGPGHVGLRARAAF